MTRSLQLGCALASVLFLVLLCLGGLYHVEKTQQFIDSGAPVDLLIFLEHASTFRQTGILYEHPDAGKPLEFIYRPSSEAFKFPPAFQLLILPLSWANLPDYSITIGAMKIVSDPAFRDSRIVAILIFWSCIALLLAISRQNTPGNKRSDAYLIAAILLAFALTSDALFRQLQYMNAELLILCICILSVVLLVRRPVAAGLLTGFVAAIKIYPGLLLVYHAASGNKRAAMAALVGFVLVSLLAVAVIGPDENLFYFSAVLPSLLREPLWQHDFNVSLGNLLREFCRTDASADAIFTGIRLIVAGLTTWLIYRYRQHPACQRHTYSLMLLCMLVLMQNLWSAYLLLTLLPLLICIEDTVSQPSWFKAMILLSLLVLLGVDLDWWLEIQLLKDISADAAALASHWQAKPYLEQLCKQTVLLLPWVESFIAGCNHFKGIVPLVLWLWIACILITRPIARAYR